MRRRVLEWLWLGLTLVLGACGWGGVSPTDEELAADPLLAIASTTWPGGPEIRAVDAAGALGTNIRGLHFDPFGPFGTNVVWAVRSTPGALLGLIWNGTTLSPDAALGFAPHKLLRYPGGNGNPAAQGVTWDDEDTFPFLIVANRDNSNPRVGRSSILSYSPRSSASELVAAQEWNLTADIRSTGTDGGAKAIQWAPPPNLSFNGFFDESKGRTFSPADYPTNATNGVIFVGLDDGVVHAYILHTSGAYTRIATIQTGLPHVTALDFLEDDELWISCDNRCAGRSAVLRLNESGRFVPVQRFDRPGGMPNLDNEGFALSATSCLVFWADVRNTDKHAIRVGSRCPSGQLFLPQSLVLWAPSLRGRS